MSSNNKEQCTKLNDNIKMQDYPLKKRLRSSQEPIENKQFQPLLDETAVKSLDVIYNAALVESTVDEAYSDKPIATDKPSSSSERTDEPNDVKTNDDPFVLIELESPESPHKQFSTKPVKDMSLKEEKLRKYTGWDDKPTQYKINGEKSIWDDLKDDSQAGKHKFTWDELQDFIFNDDFDKDMKISILQDQLRFGRDEILRHKTNLAKRNSLIEIWRNTIEDLRVENESLKAKLTEMENNNNNNN